MAGKMFMAENWQRGTLLAFWHANGAWLLAGLVAGCLLLAGRATRHRGLAAWAGGAGVAAGFAMLGAAAAWPHSAVERLPWLAAGALAAGWLADRAGPRRRSLGGAAAAAASLVGGWWLAGGPVSGAALRAAAPLAGTLAAVAAAAAFGLRRSGRPWHAVATCATSYAALHLAGGPPLWSAVPLVALAASFGQFGPARARWSGILPLAAALAASVAVPAASRLGGAETGRLAMAGAAPLAILAALPWASRRLGFAGGFLSTAVTTAAAGLLLWMAAGLAGLR